MNPTQEQLTAYFSGKASAEVRQLVERWLAHDPDHQLLEQTIRLVVEAIPEEDLNKSQAPPATLRAHKRFIGTIRQQEQQHHTPTIMRRQPLYWMMAAAVACVVFLLGTGLYKNYFPTSKPNRLANLRKDTFIYARKAAVARVILPDRSIVRLFPGSSLTIDKDFNGTDRKVALSGRGYFEVTHNAEKPFYVMAGAIITRVVGTAFEVNTMRTEFSSVIVREGKVNVSENGTLLSSLLPNQEMTVNKVSGAFALQPVNADASCGWTRGIIDFRQEPLKDILHTMEYWYGVSFRIQQPALADKRFTFFIRGQQLKESIEILAAAGHFRYHIENDKVFIQ